VMVQRGRQFKLDVAATAELRRSLENNSEYLAQSTQRSQRKEA